jgi:uncharacterized damage-inducible protein DinB
VIDLLRALVAHKGHANAATLAAVQRTPGAQEDEEVLGLLHHILVANRFWLAAIRGREFVGEREMGTEKRLPALRDAFKRTHDEESAWLASATEPDCARTITHPLIPGGGCSVAEAITQVCLHSHGHRSQLAKVLRRLGGIPPANDFILWRVGRDAPQWDAP